MLFICSGNFYRSRYAEAVFNFFAESRELEWRSVSRGFKPHLATEDLSHLARTRLEEKQIPLRHTAEKPLILAETDLHSADLIIGMLEPQHRPLMRERFPNFEHTSDYWQVYDIEDEPPEVSLELIDKEIHQLFSTL